MKQKAKISKSVPQPVLFNWDDYTNLIKLVFETSQGNAKDKALAVTILWENHQKYNRFINTGIHEDLVKEVESSFIDGTLQDS